MSAFDPKRTSVARSCQGRSQRRFEALRCLSLLFGYRNRGTESPRERPMIGTQRQPELLGQTIVVIGGTSGIGLETARRARAEGASVILTGRNPARLKQAALELDTERTAAFDANDSASLQSFFEDVSGPIDHVMVTAGAPHYGPALEMPAETARRNLTDHLLLAIEVARAARQGQAARLPGIHGWPRRAPPTRWPR